jgi:hypothetical protein
MLKYLLIAVTILLVMTGCGGSRYLSNTEDVAAEAHMRLADSLANAVSLHEAALEYELVAEDYPTSRFYRTAVRNAAYLHCDPSNPEFDENASLYWFQIYHDQEISKQEKTDVEMCIGLLNRIASLRTKMTRKTTDLEQQVKYANDELRKLKDVDIKIHERRAKK